MDTNKQDLLLIQLPLELETTGKPSTSFFDNQVDIWQWNKRGGGKISKHQLIKIEGDDSGLGLPEKSVQDPGSIWSKS